ncbi:MAG: YfiR family protein [Cyclobacteriaceae bacterium]|nr:YfiR family protein [Cyclobacteriaceae bacterium]
MKKTTLFILLLFGFQFVEAQTQKYQSVFIFSFTRYVQWPDAYNQGDFEILVLGDSPIINDLKDMAQSKKVGEGRAIKVTKINGIGDIRKANILFVSANKSSQLADVLDKVNTQSILVITEEPGLGAKGSNINFIVKDGKLAFELNQTSMSRQNLKASTDLSRLAISI